MDQAGRVLGQARTTTREPEADVVLLSSFYRRVGLPMMLSREKPSLRASVLTVIVLSASRYPQYLKHFL